VREETKMPESRKLSYVNYGDGAERSRLLYGP
jgi:hypothetical protein